MGKVVMVETPVSEEAAEALRDFPDKLPIVGQMVSRALVPAGGGADPLLAVMAAIGQEARRRGLTDEEVDAELEAWNAEDRV